MSNDHTSGLVEQAVRRLPEWVRTDLSSANPVIRVRAEETLAAMIAAALADDAVEMPVTTAPLFKWGEKSPFAGRQG